MPMSKVPPSPAMATTVMSLRFMAVSPATMPDADAAVLAKVQFRQGIPTDVMG